MSPPPPDEIAPAGVLREILAPTSPEELLQAYWGRRPLFVKGHPQKLHALFDRARFDRAAARLSERSPQALRACLGDGPLFPIDHRQISPLLAAGATICATDIHAADDRLRAVVAAVKSELNYTGLVGANAYLSPDGAGLRTHYDARVVTALQVEGRKRWRFSPAPAVEWPTRNARVRPDGAVLHSGPGGDHAWEPTEAPDEARFEEVVLEPGDVLCLPAGTWHTAEASGGSLALNLYFQPVSLLDLVVEWLRGKLSDRAEWRRGLVPVLEQHVEEGRVPEAIEAEIAARIAELGPLLASLGARGSELGRRWRQWAAEMAPSGDAPASAGAAGRRQIAPGDVLRRTRRAPLKIAADADAVLLFSGDATLTLPAHAHPFARALAGRDRFVAESAVEWGGEVRYTWEDVRGVLEALVESGIVEHEG